MGSAFAACPRYVDVTTRQSTRSAARPIMRSPAAGTAGAFGPNRRMAQATANKIPKAARKTSHPENV